MRYKKKPIVIEAVATKELIAAFRNNFGSLPDWANEAYETGVIVGITDEGLTIKTLEGDHHADKEDMIIRGVKGELYPCKPDIFAVTYDKE